MIDYKKIEQISGQIERISNTIRRIQDKKSDKDNYRSIFGEYLYFSEFEGFEDEIIEVLNKNLNKLQSDLNHMFYD